MRRVSLNARRSQDDEATDELEVLLVMIEHPDLAVPVRLSTDPSVMLSEDPFQYCTRSTWRTPGDEPFLFVLVSGLVPEDKDDTPAAGSLVLEAVDNGIARTLLALNTRASISLAIVLFSSPDIIEAQWIEMQIVGSDGDPSQVRLQFSADDLNLRPCPYQRMTRARAPALYR